MGICGFYVDYYGSQVDSPFIQVRTGGLLMQDVDLIQVSCISKNSHVILCEKKSSVILKSCGFYQSLPVEDISTDYKDIIEEFDVSDSDMLEQFTTYPLYRSCYIMVDESLLTLVDVKFNKGVFTASHECPILGASDEDVTYKKLVAYPSKYVYSSSFSID
ncbi:MAG: hypothetical protein EZS28_037416 [Streblomastix strix]|uniref:Uncharacterized protein n=1 Tax=Streblomastix strix TaxID=222440 RepID=A0A5J4U900_9EUKA|nr:MAG: hypothetical protein EZS28_037416 [Streblomastix strix]